MLFLEIRRNRKLAARRSPMFEKNRFAKVFMYCGIAFWAAYLLFIGVMLPFAFQESFPGMEPYHILNQGLVIILAIDFLIRFMLPSSIQEIKPYLLLPVPKRKVIFTFLLDKLWHPFNFFWLFLFIPFALITITRFYGITGVIGYTVGIWLLMVMNGYWSTLICTLKREKFIYFLGSILFYGILTLLEFLPETGWISTLTMNWGEGFILWNPLSFGGAIVLICLLLFINYIVQLHFLYKELSHTEDTKIKHISSYKFLDRYGNVGEYMRLELKMFFRNKAPPQPVLGIYLHHVHVCDSTCQRRLWRQLHEQFHLSVLLLHIRTDDTEPHHDIRRKLYRRIDGTEREPLQYAPRQILPAMYLSSHPFPVQPYPGLHGYNSSAYVDSLSMFYNGNHICHDDANGSLQQQDCTSQHQYHR